MFKIALPALGSAILLLSCGGQNNADTEQNLERVVTHKTDTLSIFQSENGKTKYKFESPLMEVYEHAKQPYTEFREGLFVTTYNDSTMAVESTLRADYGLMLEKQDLWEAKGNVVVTNAKGEKLETQQLFWNRKTKRIYSNVDSKITSGNNVYVGEGFESDEEFKDWEFRRTVGTFEFEEKEVSQGKEAPAAQQVDEAQDPVLDSAGDSVRTTVAADRAVSGTVQEVQ